MNLNEILNKFYGMTLDYAPKALLAIITLVVGFWLIGKFVHFFKIAALKRDFDLSITKFLASVISVGLKVLLMLSAANMFGINTTSFIAILGALMVGIGMALNGSLGHLASGIMLMIFKPFKVGDLVIIGGGETGVVMEVNAFNTILKNVNNRRIIMANSNVTSNTITNITGQETTGVEMKFGIGYKDDIDKAKAIILEVGNNCPLILNEPEQIVVVRELGDNSVNLVTRPFSKSEDYWTVLFYMQENVKKAFDREGVGIPYPQMDIHMIQKPRQLSAN